MCADRKRVSGYEYHGLWKNNARSGKDGRCYYYNDELYVGDWLNDCRHGWGEQFYSQKYQDERYIGQWKNDMREGKGCLISGSSQHNNGLQHYEGKFKDDLKHGKGILRVTYNFHRVSTKPMEVKIYD